MVPGAPRAATTSGTSKCSTMASESVGRGVPHACMHENTKFSLSHILDAYFKVGAAAGVLFTAHGDDAYE